MRVVLFLILLGVNYVLSGQGLTNAVISVDDINFSSRQLVRVSDQRFLLTSFNRINNQIASTIINYNRESNTYYQFDSFDFFLSRRSTVFDGANILVIGANTANQFLSFNSWSLDFNEVYSNNILPLNDLSGVRLSMFYNNHLYAVGYDDDFGLASRSIDFRKFSKTGDELVAHKLDQAVVFNMVQDIDSTLDNHLVMSSRIAYSSDGGRFSQLTKINTLGEVIWQVEGSEAFGQNYWVNYIAQLSNGNIVETYKIENNTNPEYNESAIRMRWVDADGVFVTEKLINYPKNDLFEIEDLESGKGDYFYAYGNYSDSVNSSYYFGLVIKYDLEGNEIWRKGYKHPDYLNDFSAVLIKDIEELDNGNLLIYADLSLWPEYNKIWLFEVDANGCHDADNCDEINILTTATHEIDATLPTPTIVYPNPTDGITYIHDDVRLSINRLELYDTQGALLQSWYTDIPMEINMSLYTVGTYILKTTLKSGRIVSEKVVLIDN